MASFQLVVLCLCLLAVASARKCGQTPKMASDPWRIVGGANAEKNAWPWQISLRMRTWMGFQHICGGSLISDQYVVTAAHCVDGNSQATSYMVRMGEHNTQVNDGTEVDAPISKVIKHEQYNGKTINNDVALLKLSNPVDFKKHPHLGTVCMPEKNWNVDGEMAWATGWGHTSFQGSSPANLQEVTVPILSHNTCKKAYTGVNEVTNGMICAGYEQGGKSVCQGDSGGPLVCNKDGAWTLAGVTSWGVGCAEPGYPGVYARVSTYIDWMKQKMATN